MSNLRWLASVLAPHDIAPHPNLTSEEFIDQCSLFALLASVRLADYSRLTGQAFFSSRGDSRVTPLNTTNLLFQVLASDSSEEEDLEELLRSTAVDEYEDICHQTAVALFCATLLGEQDADMRAVELIDQTLNEFPNLTDVGPEEQVCYAALALQKARRLFDAGVEADTQLVDRAVATLENVEHGNFASYTVSVGVSWNSSYTTNEILQTMTQVGRRMASVRDRTLELGDWRQAIQTRPPYLVLRASGRALEDYSELIGKFMREQIGDRSISIGAGTDGSERLYSALLFFEFFGSQECMLWRGRLGAYLFLLANRSTDARKTYYMEQSLRFFRRAQKKRELQSALTYVRTNGPLEAARCEAERVVLTRPDPKRLRICELLVLSEAGGLLSSELATQALGAVIQRVSIRIPSLDDSWSADGVILEAVWGAAVALALPASRTEGVVIELLRSVSVVEETDELTDRAYASAALSIDWRGLSDAIRDQWSGWTQSSGHVLPLLAQAVRSSLGIPPQGSEHDDDESLEAVARLLNRSIMLGTSPDLMQFRVAEATVTQRMGMIRERARQGSYGLGGYPACDLAVGLAMIASNRETADLWTAIEGFLADPNVARFDKDAALESIARNPYDLPSSLGEALSAARTELLGSESTFGHTITPYPSAIRALAATGVLSNAETLRFCAELSAAPTGLAHVEAARTLTTISRLTDPPEWIYVLSTQLSLDSEAGARAEAGRCLSILWSKMTAFQEQIEKRLAELLSEDGIIIPLLTVRGLTESRDGLPDSIRSLILELAERHPDAAIRLVSQQIREN